MQQPRLDLSRPQGQDLQAHFQNFRHLRLAEVARVAQAAVDPKLDQWGQCLHWSGRYPLHHLALLAVYPGSFCFQAEGLMSEWDLAHPLS